MLKAIPKTKKEEEEFAKSLKQYQKFQEKVEEKTIKPTRQVFVPGMPMCIICDIDGTLAIRTERGPFDFSRLEEDVPNKAVLLILDLLFKEGKVKIMLVSGREKKYQEATLRWLTKYQIPFHEIYMRETDDKRLDSIIKKELYTWNISQKYNVAFALEDRKRVKKMWVENGIFVLDVNQTDAEF